MAQNKTGTWGHQRKYPDITNGGVHTVPGGSGGTAGTDISSIPATLENFLVAGGASQTGTVYNLPSGRVTIQGVANGSAGAYTATITVKVSNDNSNWITLGSISLSGTATTADSDGFASDAPWSYIRADVSSFTGTGATCDVYLGV